MAMIYKFNVSIYQNTKGAITVKRDDTGNYNANNAADLYKKMLELGKKLKAEVRIFKPKADGNTPLLFADRYGNPYLALLPAREAPTGDTVSVKKVVKLA